MKSGIGIAGMSSLKTAQTLGKAGFEQKQAEAIAECIYEYSTLVASQIAELEDKLLKQLAEYRQETDRKIAEHRQETDRQITEMRKDMRKLTLALVGMMITAVGVTTVLVANFS